MQGVYGRILLVYNQCDEYLLVIVVGEVVFFDEILPYFLERFVGPFIVGSLESVEHGGPDQQVREGHHDQGQGPHIATLHPIVRLRAFTYYKVQFLILVTFVQLYSLLHDPEVRYVVMVFAVVVVAVATVVSIAAGPD